MNFTWLLHFSLSWNNSSDFISPDNNNYRSISQLKTRAEWAEYKEMHPLTNI